MHGDYLFKAGRHAPAPSFLSPVFIGCACVRAFAIQDCPVSEVVCDVIPTGKQREVWHFLGRHLRSPTDGDMCAARAATSGGGVVRSAAGRHASSDAEAGAES